MKNITLSVDETVLAVVRRYAAERDCSVNALVRDYLTRLAERQDRAKKARENIRKLSSGSAARIGAKSWSRAELHER
jgi:hypothetical protein